jgi:hypothetical protein
MNVKIISRLRVGSCPGLRPATVLRDVELEQPGGFESQDVGPLLVAQHTHRTFDRLGQVSPAALVMWIILGPQKAIGQIVRGCCDQREGFSWNEVKPSAWGTERRRFYSDPYRPGSSLGRTYCPAARIISDRSEIWGIENGEYGISVLLLPPVLGIAKTNADDSRVRGSIAWHSWTEPSGMTSPVTRTGPLPTSPRTNCSPKNRADHVGAGRSLVRLSPPHRKSLGCLSLGRELCYAQSCGQTCGR